MRYLGSGRHGRQVLLKVFLAALAIVDDIVAVFVIALPYTSGISCQGWKLWGMGKSPAGDGV